MSVDQCRYLCSDEVDFFRIIPLVETVMKLSQRKPNDVIEINMDWEELDINSAKTKATYREMQRVDIRLIEKSRLSAVLLRNQKGGSYYV